MAKPEWIRRVPAIRLSARRGRTGPSLRCLALAAAGAGCALERGAAGFDAAAAALLALAPSYTAPVGRRARRRAPSLS